MAKRTWTDAQRTAQSERIRAWRPWEKSTGPRSEEGKSVAARNAWAGGHRVSLRRLARELRALPDGLEDD